MSNGVLELVARVAAGEVRALARAVSVVEDGGFGAEELVEACRRSGRRERRIGITGAAGVGKSTLVEGMVTWLRGRGERVAVLAVDPTSALTGGALLGDRIRMRGLVGDAGVFVRSMASRGAVGGMAGRMGEVCAVLEAGGFRTVIVETMGVGQAEVAVTGLVDVTLLVLMPGAGDDVQALKAGLMEMASVYVVNKGDLVGAERVVAEILAVQGLSDKDTAPVVRTCATTGEGLGRMMDVVWEMLEARRS